MSPGFRIHLRPLPSLSRTRYGATQTKHVGPGAGRPTSNPGDDQLDSLGPEGLAPGCQRRDPSPTQTRGSAFVAGLRRHRNPNRVTFGADSCPQVRERCQGGWDLSAGPPRTKSPGMRNGTPLFMAPPSARTSAVPGMGSARVGSIAITLANTPRAEATRGTSHNRNQPHRTHSPTESGDGWGGVSPTTGTRPADPPSQRPRN